MLKYTYFGAHIHCNTTGMWRWTSYAGGGFLRADTLQGIRELIRDAVKG